MTKVFPDNFDGLTLSDAVPISLDHFCGYYIEDKILGGFYDGPYETEKAAREAQLKWITTRIKDYRNALHFYERLKLEFEEREERERRRAKSEHRKAKRLARVAAAEQFDLPNTAEYRQPAGKVVNNYYKSVGKSALFVYNNKLKSGRWLKIIAGPTEELYKEGLKSALQKAGYQVHAISLLYYSSLWRPYSYLRVDLT